MKKICRACSEEKPITSFYRHSTTRDGYRHVCISCEKIPRQNRAKDYYKRIQKESRLLKAYGLSLQQYEALLQEQNSTCKICGNPERSKNSKGLSVDHDHLTGKVRGLLCINCNTALGNIRDDPHLAVNLARYLGWKAWNTTVFLSGAIEGCDDLGAGWRQIASSFLEEHGYRVINPVISCDEQIFKTSNEIVHRNMFLLKQADIVLAEHTIPNRNYLGTIYEMTKALDMQKPVIVWSDESYKERVYLQHVSTVILPTLEECLDYIQAFYPL